MTLLTRQALQELLDGSWRELGGHDQIACASLAVMKGNRIQVCGANVKPEAVFHVGSITKMFTAFLVMQGVERGQLRLDGTLADYLPELALREAGALNRITLQHLLNHTSGVDGDWFVDTGEAESYLPMLVKSCAGVELLHQPGAFFSYCNLGYNLLGRILEKTRCEQWDDILAQDILRPLELHSASTYQESELPTVRGYTVDSESGQPRQLEPESRSNTPSGTRLRMNASDLLRFASQFFAAPPGDDNKRLLSRRGLQHMQSKMIDTPFSDSYRGWGLGLMHFAPGVVGHNGGTAGTTSFLRIVPEQNLAIALMTNSHQYRALVRELFDPLFGELSGVAVPPVRNGTVGEPCLPANNYTGRYERHGLSAEIYRHQGGLKMRLGGEYGYPNAPAGALRVLNREHSRVDLPEIDGDFPVGFLAFDGAGCPAYLHFQDRVYRRVGAATQEVMDFEQGCANG